MNLIGGESHETLKYIEGKRLRNHGYSVEYEKRVLSGWIADIVAKKGNETIVIEVGYCQKHESEIFALLKKVDKFIHVTDLRKWIRWTDLMEISEARMRGVTVRQLREFYRKMEMEPYDWTEQLKDSEITMDFDWIKEEVNKIKERLRE